MWRLLVLLFFVLSPGCIDSSEKPSPGEKLAGQYCSSCHEVPPPDALSRDLWEDILPNMGARLGFNFTQQEARMYQELSELGMTPESPVISRQDWEILQRYYLLGSPDSLPAFITDISSDSLELFHPLLIRMTESPPAGSMVRFDPGGESVWYGDAQSWKLYNYNLNTRTSEEWQLDGAPSDIKFTESGFEILTMGDIFPNDLYKGKLTNIEAGISTVLADSLPRPVDVTYGDLNGDGQKDFVISGFGFLKGNLAWYENTGDSYIPHILRDEPGAIRAEILDLNNDGHLDILVLMAQGIEGFFVYLGDSGGQFTEKQLYSFPPYFGSSYFELADMNGDGRVDIIYANGDTGDYHYPALKPYHAVRILIQEEPMEFREATSFPIHGPFNSMVEDYDMDGDPDIAVTSYFPDYSNSPREGFLFLENQGDLTFVAKSFNQAMFGNWLSSDRADFDGDGDIDILLGNGPVIRSKVDPWINRIWQKHQNSVLLLVNKTIDESLTNESSDFQGQE